MADVATYKGRRDDAGVPQEFLSGIPARDLDEADWEALSEAQQDAVRASELYTVRGAARKTAEKEDAE